MQEQVVVISYQEIAKASSTLQEDAKLPGLLKETWGLQHSVILVSSYISLSSPHNYYLYTVFYRGKIYVNLKAKILTV